MSKDTHIDSMSQKVGVHKAALERFIRSKTAQSEVDDVLQDVWTKLFEHPAPESIRQLRQWLIAVARNVILDRRRKCKQIPFSALLPEEGLEEHHTKELFFELWVEQSLPSDVAESTEFWEALKAELANLPKEQREVFVAHELEGLPLKVLSAQTGVSVKTLISRKRYAVQQLRKRFEHLKK